MAIRNPKLYFRFAILALFAAFSSTSHAFTQGYYYSAYQTGQCFKSAAAACAALSGQMTFGGTDCRQWNPSTNAYQSKGSNAVSCDADCTPGDIRNNGLCGAPSTCTNGRVIDPVSGECLFPTTCPSGESVMSITGANGVVTSARCVPNVATPNQKCASYSDMQTAYCQGQAATCTQGGGTFGAINGNNVCVPPGDALPTCASGATQFVLNSDLSKTPTCVGTPNLSGSGSNTELPKGVVGGTPETATSAVSGARTANNTAEIARINAEGFQAMVNAINNNTGKTAAGGGSGSGSTAAQDQSNSAGVIAAINAAKDSEHGAGTCDPHAANYSECVGQSETAPDNDGSGSRSAAIAAGNDSIDAAADYVVAGIEAAADQAVPETGSFKSTFLSYLPQPEACNDWSTSFKGVSFQIRCTQTSMFREWAAWVLALLTMYGIFVIMFRRVA